MKKRKDEGRNKRKNSKINDKKRVKNQQKQIKNKVLTSEGKRGLGVKNA